MRQPVLFVFFVLAVQCCGLDSLAQCQYDQGGNGLVNPDDDILPVLANFGAEGLDPNPTDYNGNGVTDFLDLVATFRHMGLSCPLPELVQVSGNVLGLVVQEYALHETAVIDPVDTIPAGSATYRLFLHVADPDIRLRAVYGVEAAPLQIMTTGEFFFSSLGHVNAGYINPVFYPIAETLQYCSWVSCNFDPEGDALADFPVTLDDPDQPWIEEFPLTGNIECSTLSGGGWLTLDAYEDQENIFPNLLLLGQFTIGPGETFEGILNAEVRVPIEGDIDQYEIAEGLSFSSENVAVFGCTDPTAENYNPEATQNDGSCSYFGDLDGDGMIGTGDILDIIDDFGCTTCEDADLDGNGVVGVGDLLLLLGLI